jgi:acyl-CoA synthetase (AMP-forming)/AMP-acid ligase II/acyl carrier protein
VVERQNETVYQLLHGWAKETPEAVALLAPGREPITYRQLFEQIDATIKSLREIGLGRNDRIAIVLPNGVETAALLLGVACAAICAPLNPSYRENEFESFLRDLGAKALVVQSGAHSPAVLVAQHRGIPVIELVSHSNAGSVCLTTKAAEPVCSSRQHPPEPDHVALMLHTSGTTSKPKKVPLTHGNLCASAYSIRESLALTTGDRCLGVMPLFHIHGLVGGLLCSLAAGASFVATPEWDPGCFFDCMQQFKPTWYTAVPTFHQAILMQAGQRRKTSHTGALRLIRSASAPLPRSLRMQLEEAFDVPVIEAYGMTEAAHQIASNPLSPGERKAGSVGVPTGTEVAIMDAAGNLFTAGASGEVVIRGANVTKGYEPNEANVEAFIEGWLRTGDLGYFDSEGYLFLTGRLKEIINRGGEKILPREIDDLLLEHPGVLHAVAFAIPHASLGEDVAAAVVVRDRKTVTEASLRNYLMSRLAAFKLPARLLIVDEIPAGPTGKVRRTALPEIFAARLQTGFMAPKDTLEELVANIYAEVLEVPRVGASDNFFALGGDSLRATQVISRVRSLFSVNLPISSVFLKSTVRQLAGEIAASMEARDGNLREAMFSQSSIDVSEAISQPTRYHCDGSKRSKN